MLAKIRKFFAEPSLDLEEEARLTGLLSAILRFGTLITTATFILNLANNLASPWPGLILNGANILVFLISWFLYLIKKVNWSARFLVFSLGGIVAGSTILSKGILGLSYSGYIIVILLAALLLGWKSGVIVFLLSTVTSGVTLLLETRDSLPFIEASSSPMNLWFSAISIFIWVLYLVYIANWNLRKALTQAQENEKGLLESQEEQKKISKSLEIYTQDLERRIVQLQVAAEVAREATMIQQVDELLDRAVNLVRERFGFYHAGIFMLDEKGEYASLKSATGEAGAKMIIAGHKLKVGEVGIVGYVTATGQPRIALDVGSDAVYFQNPLLPETRSEMALPLKIGEKVFGALDVQSKQPSAFDDDDIRILQTMADQLAIAISNARLFEETRRQLDELTALHAVATAGAEAINEDDLIERATQIIASAFFPDNFGMLLIDGTKEHLITHPSYRERRKVEHEPIPLDRGIVGYVARDGKPLRIADVSKEPSYLEVDPDIRSELAVPMKVGKNVIGVINTESNLIDDFSAADERLLSTIAGQLSTAIEKLRLFKAAQKRVEELEALHLAGLHLTSDMELHSLLEALLDQAIRLITADSAHVYLYDGETLHFGAAFWHENYPRAKRETPRPHGLTYKVARSGKRLVVPDVLNDPLFADSPWNGAVIGLPLRRGERVLGVMNIAYQGRTHSFDENELRVLELLADQAALALYNASLYNEAQQRAKDLAQALAQREELDRIREEFIQNVSHELRTPLAITRGYIDLLLTNELGELTEPQLDALNILSRRINLLVKLVDDLVVILEAEIRKPARDEVNFSEVVSGCIADYRDLAKKSNLQLSATLPKERVVVMGNFAHLCRLVDNLVSNAVKFTPPKGKIDVTLAMDENHAILSVSDTGVGISEDKIEHIFERFYQVDGSTKRKFGGIGLGLSLVKEISNAHGGSVTVTSEVGKGSTFIVTLPRIH